MSKTVGLGDVYSYRWVANVNIYAGEKTQRMLIGTARENYKTSANKTILKKETLENLCMQTILNRMEHLHSSHRLRFAHQGNEKAVWLFVL